MVQQYKKEGKCIEKIYADYFNKTVKTKHKSACGYLLLAIKCHNQN